MTTDLIRRQDAIEAFAAECDGPYEACMQVATELFKDIPSARTIGEWEHRKIVGDSESAIIPEWQQAQCSVCGLWHTTPYQYHFKHYKYCPNCGAEMEVEDELDR